MLSRVVLMRLLPYAVLIAALVGAYFYVSSVAYNNGVEDTTLKYENAIKNERERLQVANEAATQEARRKEVELNILLRERNATISQLLQDSLSDPLASRPSIFIDGVRRIDRIH